LPNCGATTSTESIPIEPVDAEATLRWVRSLVEKVKKHPPSLEEALRTPLDLEKKLYVFNG
jgi:hypothetical protein